MDRESVKAVLEQHMDKLGMALVLELMSEVCAEKAQHAESAWQDRALAAAWDALATKLDAVRVAARKSLP